MRFHLFGTFLFVNCKQEYLPGKHLLVQNQQWKHDIKVWNTFIVNKGDTFFEHFLHPHLGFCCWLYTAKCLLCRYSFLLYANENIKSKWNPAFCVFLCELCKNAFLIMVVIIRQKSLKIVTDRIKYIDIEETMISWPHIHE